MLFSQVKGQKQLLNKIVSLIDTKRFPHAVLLNGKDGYGNLAVALALAQYVACTSEHKNGDSCDDCPTCKKYMKLVHPDLHFIFPNTTTSSVKQDNESKLFVNKFREFVLSNGGYCSLLQWYDYLGSENKQGVINVRDANNIISTLTLKTYESPYKVMIIWNADKMNHECSDKILKILEEPYPNTIFILTTEHKDRMIQTILSRVQQITVPPLDDETMYNEIKNYNPSLSEEEIRQRIALCEGDFIRIAELDSQYEKSLRNNFIAINRLAIMYRKNAKEISSFVDILNKITREQLKDFLDYYARTIDKCLLFNNGVRQINPLTFAEEKFKNNFPKFITTNNIEGIFDVVEQARKNVDANANAKINLFNLIIQLGTLFERK